jgi:hypothetical protein
MFKINQLLGFFFPRLMLGGGGGGSSAPASQTTTTQNAISSYAAPYVENMLGKTEALTSQPYQNYTGQRTADFTDLQNQAFQGVGGLDVAQQNTMGSNLASSSGIGALNVARQQNPWNFQQQVGGYMNPYIQQALAPQLQEMQRQYGITGAQEQGQATGAGAFGGSREAIMAAENERNKNTAMNNAIAQGYNTAFTNAQNQYNQGTQNQLAGLGAANQAAGTLGQLGTNQYNQQTGILGLQNQMGTQQQQQQQNILNQQYQDFLTQKQNPYNQLSFMQNMLSGLPMTSTTQNVYSNPSTLSQVAGLGTAGAGAYGMYKGLAGSAAKEGGSTKDIKKRPAGLAELALHKMA